MAGLHSGNGGASHEVAEHFAQALRSWGANRGGPMINFPKLTATMLWRAGLLALLAWAAGGAIDGATLGELVGVPILVAGWMSAVVLIDRLVMKGHRSGTTRPA
jgi:hypothetical protein